MNQEKQYTSNDFLNQYLKKAFILLPLTFLMTPLFYTFFGYHPEIKFFKLLFYFWFAFFIYLGMTLTIVLGKYKNLAYPIIIIVAFLLKNIMMFPGLGVAQNLIYALNPGSLEEAYEMRTGVPLNPDVYLYLAAAVFTSSMIAGFVGAIYAKKTAAEFIERNNTFILAYFTIGSGTYFYYSGIWQFDESAITMYVAYLVCLAISYFLVRNFAQLNRQLEVYAENGAYNVSGTKKIYAYFFTTLIFLMAALPLLALLGFLIVPHVVSGAEYVIALIIWLVLHVPNPFEEVELPPRDDVILEDYMRKPPPENHNLFLYYILVGIFLIIIFFFRKPIKELISLIIEYFKKKFGNSETGMNIINQEIITEIKKVKKTKTSYKDYMKKARKITNLRERFLFAYNYIFWGIIKKDKDLKESATPNEVAEKYDETESLAELYQNIKYGRKSEESGDVLTDMTVKAESFIREKL